MAPPASKGGRNLGRGRGGARGNSVRGRGRGSSRGRGRGKSSSGGIRQPTFHSTRVDEQIDSFKDSERPSEKPAEEEIYLNEDSSSDDGVQEQPSVKPYYALLRSLNPKSDRGQPHRKKQKTQLDDRNLEPQTRENSRLELEDELDPVDETQELEKSSQDEVLEVDEADENLEENADDLDHFETHFSNPDSNTITQSIKAIARRDWSIQNSQLLPGWKVSCSLPQNCKMPSALSTVKSCEDLQLKKKFKVSAEKHLPELVGLNSLLASAIFSYQDVLFSNRTPGNAQDLRALVCLHSLNHIFKTRDRVIKNNTRLAKSDTTEDLEYRDQGFTRPKVLMLLPTRQACVKAVDLILSLCEPEQQENKKRFQDMYAQGEDNFSEDKPADFRELFEGNDDDLFRIGLKFTRKTVKLFSQFYNSDIIFASPLGLRMAIGTEDSKKKDYDFLSSIEIVAVDQADALLMQNWEHLEYIFEHLNLLPTEVRGCDISRLREWYLDGNAKFLRQNIVLSAFNTPELNRLFGHDMRNCFGKQKISQDSHEGVILDLGIPAKQTFSRYDSPSLIDDPDVRFAYFTTTIVPLLAKYAKSSSRGGQGVLIFVSSYMDFVRIRNFLGNSTAAEDISFGSISEYTSVRDVARARSHFFSGRHSVLLYTGRAHHFRRYHLRGVKNVVMYSLPDNPVFYSEIAGGFLSNSVSEGKVELSDASIRCIFSKWDVLKLMRIVGTTRCVSIFKEKGGDTFDFV